MQGLQLSQLNSPQRPPSPSTIILASIFQHMNFGGWDTNIRSITPSLKHPSTKSSDALCRSCWLSSFHRILVSYLWCPQVYFPDDILPPDYVHSPLLKHPIIVFHASIGSPVLTYPTWRTCNWAISPISVSSKYLVIKPDTLYYLSMFYKEKL